MNNTSEIAACIWIAAPYTSEQDIAIQELLIERLSDRIYQLLENDATTQALLSEHQAQLLQPTATYR